MIADVGHGLEDERGFPPDAVLTKWCVPWTRSLTRPLEASLRCGAGTDEKKSADCSTLFFVFWLPDLDSNQGPAD